MSEFVFVHYLFVLWIKSYIKSALIVYMENECALMALNTKLNKRNFNYLHCNNKILLKRVFIVKKIDIQWQLKEEKKSIYRLRNPEWMNDSFNNLPRKHRKQILQQN